MAPMLKLHLPPMSESLLASVDETDQRCLIVGAGGRAAGAVACLDTAPAPLATLVGVGGRRAAQNASTASVTAALISA
jgi:shikimate 5-dehydrogenase